MPDDVHKSGWPAKQSSAKGIFANTRKRYFVLYDHTLKYYAKPEDTTPKGEVKRVGNIPISPALAESMESQRVALS